MGVMKNILIEAQGNIKKAEKLLKQRAYEKTRKGTAKVADSSNPDRYLDLPEDKQSDNLDSSQDKQTQT
jgi:hypothetical protein